MTKYDSGWKGPARIIDNTNIACGTLTVCYQRDLPIKVRHQIMRRHLYFFCFLAAPQSPLDAGTAEMVRTRTRVDELPSGKLAQIGMTRTSHGWPTTSSLTYRTAIKFPWLAHVCSHSATVDKSSLVVLRKRTRTHTGKYRLHYGIAHVALSFTRSFSFRHNCK